MSSSLSLSLSLSSNFDGLRKRRGHGKVDRPGGRDSGGRFRGPSGQAAIEVVSPYQSGGEGEGVGRQLPWVH